ncbi:unnamed protein product, partial [Notodromas monacha]
MALRHFLTLRDLSTLELNQVVQRGIELKRKQHNSEVFQPFVGKVMGMIFEKSSTRTRVSFEAGMSQFGGSAIFLSPRDTQLGRELVNSAEDAAVNADLIVTDVWASMGQEEEQKIREAAFADYQ